MCHAFLHLLKSDIFILYEKAEHFFRTFICAHVNLEYDVN